MHVCVRKAQSVPFACVACACVHASARVLGFRHALQLGREHSGCLTHSQRPASLHAGYLQWLQDFGLSRLQNTTLITQEPGVGTVRLQSVCVCVCVCVCICVCVCVCVCVKNETKARPMCVCVCVCTCRPLSFIGLATALSSVPCR